MLTFSYCCSWVLSIMGTSSVSGTSWISSSVFASSSLAASSPPSSGTASSSKVSSTSFSSWFASYLSNWDAAYSTTSSCCCSFNSGISFPHPAVIAADNSTTAAPVTFFFIFILPLFCIIHIFLFQLYINKWNHKGRNAHDQAYDHSVQRLHFTEII